MAEQNQQQPQQPKRYIPATDTEFQSNITRPTWSDRSQVPDVDRRVSKRLFVTDETGAFVTDKEGKPVIVDESLLMIYQMFTQDIRLGNLTPDELDYCREHIDLAQDLMQMGYNKPAVVVFERGISVLETSHSRNGWFRGLLGTVTTKQEQTYYEPKKSFWTGRKD